jgi:hypothetical protein
MNDKPIENKEEHSLVEKKAYTPPVLTAYGKLTELTAGGAGSVTEAVAMNSSKNNQKT